MLAKEKDCISVAFNENVLRMAYVHVSPAKSEVRNLIRRDITGVGEDELPVIIKEAAASFAVKKPQVIGIVSSAMTTTKNIEIPSLDTKEIESIINLQAGRHTPYSREEIIIDYINIGVYQRNYSKILLAIVNRDTIKKQLSVLEQAGLKVQRVLFASEGIARFYATAMALDKKAAPAGIIDFGSQSTDFAIEFHGTIIACRNIPIGVAHLAKEGKAAADRLVAELKKSVESYQSEDIEKAPERYLVTDETTRTKDLQPVLQQALGVPVDIVSYREKVVIAPAAQQAIADAGEESFLDMIAPPIVMHESRIDLTPEEVKIQRSIEQQGIEIAKLGILGLLMLGLLCGIFFSKIYFKSAILASLQESHGSQKQEAEALEHISEKTRIVKDFLHSRMVSLDTINELYSIIPDEIYLQGIVLDENGAITIDGISESMSRVFSLVGDLEDSALFKGVKTTSTTAKKERGKDVAAFQIVLKLESAQDDDVVVADESQEPAKDAE